MTTDIFYGRHHDLDNHYIISISLMTTYILMTTDMFYGRHNDVLNRYIIYKNISVVISEK
jgi:hypothetical protein